MSIAFDLVETLPVGNTIGECPLWDDRTETVHWTDILARRFWSWKFGTALFSSVALPEQLASMALTEMPGVFVGAFDKGFARFEPARGSFEPLVDIEARHPQLAMNDGRVDRTGTFWASTKLVGEQPDRGSSGKLWRFDGPSHASPFLGGLLVPNGLAFTGDGRSMFLADSEKAAIWKFALDREDGPIGCALFAQTAPGVKPDGGGIDAEDRYWSAHWGGGAIVCYATDSTVVAQLDLPVSQPSCVAFGGPLLDHLIVTSAREGLSAEALAREPLAGSLFVFRTNVRGRREDRCTGDFAQALAA